MKRKSEKISALEIEKLNTETHGVAIKHANLSNLKIPGLLDFYNFLTLTKNRNGVEYAERSIENFCGAMSELKKFLNALFEYQASVGEQELLFQYQELREIENFPTPYRIGNKYAINFKDMQKLFHNNYSATMKAYERFLEWNILLDHEAKQNLFPEEISPNGKRFNEGAKKQIIVNVYERDLSARKKCIAHYGHLCSVCEFDFGVVYGELGKEFIHVHHLRALSEIGKEYEVDPINDLRPVCPNCHAMLHRGRVTLAIEDLKEIIKNQSEK